jgi:hypothetical protein
VVEIVSQLYSGAIIPNLPEDARDVFVLEEGVYVFFTIGERTQTSVDQDLNTQDFETIRAVSLGRKVGYIAFGSAEVALRALQILGYEWITHAVW